jgi:hypothetical protein
MEALKDILFLFLQLTAIQIFFFTWWSVRKPQLCLSTAVFVLNIDLALRTKTYGECQCLSDYLDQIMPKPDNGGERIIYGYRKPTRNNDVIKELSNWKPTEFHGPVWYGDTGDNEQRWETELQGIKWRYSYRGVIPGGQHLVSEYGFNRGPLAQLHESLRSKYNYEIGDFGAKEKSTQISFNDEEPDLFASILEHLEKQCPDIKETVKAFRDLGRASKIVNILQVKNPYHESVHNIHLRVSSKHRGVMKLSNEFAEKEGFKIVNNTTQYAHLILGELPPNSERYCLIETGVIPLSESYIEMQSDLLYKLSPQIMKRIALIAGVIAILITLFSPSISNESSNKRIKLTQNPLLL